MLFALEKRLLDHLPTPVVCEDGERRIVYTNRAFRRLFEPEPRVEEMCARFFDLVAQRGSLFVDPSAFERRASELLSQCEAGSVFGVTLSDGREFVCDYVPLGDGQREVAHIWSFRDVNLRRWI
mgnify:FL=1